jgi:hypothetical protein
MVSCTVARAARPGRHTLSETDSTTRQSVPPVACTFDCDAFCPQHGRYGGVGTLAFRLYLLVAGLAVSWGASADSRKHGRMAEDCEPAARKRVRVGHSECGAIKVVRGLWNGIVSSWTR